MSTYRGCYTFADLTFQIEHDHRYSEVMCRDYSSDRSPDFYLQITKRDVEQERVRNGAPEVSDGYLEFLTIYRQICSLAAERGVILFHSSAVAVDGIAYLFAAPSGTGKSTHTALWRTLLGERAVMINDDKPLLRVSEQGIVAFGTPWNGKHALGINASAKVGGICLLSRGEQNRIAPVPHFSAFGALMAQTFRPDTPEGTAQVVSLVSKLCRRVPIWSLEANMEVDAARLAYETMKNGGVSL